MSLALYRKYRPQNFASVVNQEHIKITLENQIKLSAIAHAYLFYGPRGIGKTTLARIFAKALLCEKRKKGSSEPCLNCSSCTSITLGNYLDVIEMDAATHTQVDKVRSNIIETARLLPSQGKFKIFIIDEVHMLSTSSFNALLKIIEEPPEHVLFILATTEIFKVPATIISRCQRFDFKKIPIDLTMLRLKHIVSEEKRKVDSEVIGYIAHASEGSLRDAESLLGKVLSLPEEHISKEVAELVLPTADVALVRKLASLIREKNIPEAIYLVLEIAEGGIELEHLTDDLIELWRKAMLFKVNAGDAVLSIDDEREWLKEYADNVPLSTIERYLELALKARRELRFASIPTLPLELMIIEAVGDESSGDESEENKDGGISSSLNGALKDSGKSKEEKKKTKHTNSGFAFIIEKWHEVINRASLENGTLAVILRLTNPTSLTHNTLTLGTRYEIYLSKLSDIKVKKMLENILKEVYGQELLFEPVLIKADDVKINKEEDSVNRIAEAFGGTVL